MFGLLSKSRRLNLPVDIQLQLFDILVTPILLYGSEIWSYENCEILEKLHLRYCKYLLGVNISTYKNMVYGELGRYPLSVTMKLRTAVFWRRLITGDQSKLSAKMYRLLFKLDAVGIYSSPWITNVRDILNDSGFSYMWLYQTSTTTNDSFRAQLKVRLQDQFQQTWSSEVFNSSKCINYRMFKSKLQFEEYLLKLPRSLCRSFTRFRCRNHKLPIELGAHLNIVRDMRVCSKCNSNAIGDEFHYVFNCTNLATYRKKLLPKFCQENPSSLKFQSIMNTQEIVCLTKLVKFINIIMSAA